MSLYHYCFQRITPQNTKADKISDTVEFRHQYITTPLVTPENCIVHGLNTLMGALTDATTAQYDAQLQSITALFHASASWAYSGDTPSPASPAP